MPPQFAQPKNLGTGDLVSGRSLQRLLLTGQQPTTTGPYTAAQADAGRTAYQANCAGCHGPDLGGRNDAAQLAGSLFMGSWGGRTTSDLLGFMQGSMPPGNPGGLGEATYLNIAAFILDSNGARPGTQAADGHDQCRHPLDRHRPIARTDRSG